MKGYKILKITNFLLIAVFVAVVCARLYYTDKAATAGNDLALLNERIYELQKENESLKAEYLSLSSLSVINERAAVLGLAAAGVEYLNAPELAAR